MVGQLKYVDSKELYKLSVHSNLENDLKKSFLEYVYLFLISGPSCTLSLNSLIKKTNLEGTLLSTSKFITKSL